jgi:hypothetical protein
MNTTPEKRRRFLLIHASGKILALLKILMHTRDGRQTHGKDFSTRVP